MLDSDPIGLIKERISDMEGIPTKQMRLITAGKQLDEDRSIGSYDVKAEATLHVVPPLIRYSTNFRP